MKMCFFPKQILGMVSVLVFLLIAAKPAKAEAPAVQQGTTGKENSSQAPRFPLSSDDLFFTEPYHLLVPGTKGLLAMDLALDYVSIRYDYGIANTLDPKEPLLDFQKRVQVKNPEQLSRIKSASGFSRGDPVTVVSMQGRVYSARVAGFSYVGNSPSTALVVADLELSSKKTDPSLWKRPGLAFRGEVRGMEKVEVFAGEPLSRKDSLFPRLFRLCAGEVSAEREFSQVRVVPGNLDSEEQPAYFVSFWERPRENFEIDEVVLKSCLFKPVEKGWVKAETALPLEVEQLFDLDGDGRKEIFALSGNGEEVCWLYLVPREDSYLLLKRALCSGY